MIRALLDESDLDASQLLELACSQSDNPKLVAMLLNNPRVDPNYDSCACLMSAAEQGLYETVKLLLEDGRVDPNYDEAAALDLAIESGHTDVARLLLADPRTDPSLNDNKALFGAIHDCEYDMIRELARHPLVRASVDWSHMLGHAMETEDSERIALVASLSTL
ncbi:Ankyrin repeat protein [uncultured virus]|nr:Ankyrin repeat protein [uncultured virus]